MVPLIILGCGYVGARLTRAALADGRTVRVCARGTGRLAPLGEIGAQVKYLDAGVPRQLGPVMSGLPGATVVYSIPPVGALPPGQAIRATLQAAYGAGAACFVHFSSAGLYGSAPDEHEVETCAFERLRTVILRLAPVYGPGRGLRERIRKGEYRILDDGQHATSRIHIDDVVRVVFAAEAHASHGARYLVADDEPTTQGEYT